MRFFRRAAALCGLTVFLVFTTGSGIRASSINITTTYQVTSVDPGVTAIAVGDRFTVTYTLNDAITDTNAATGGGQFPSLATSFSATRAGTNVGTWAPSGTFDLAGSNYVSEAGGDHVTIQMHGTGFPDGGPGASFWDFSMGFTWPLDITDAGSGETFAQQLHGTFGVPPATNLASAIRFIPSAGVRGASVTFIVANIDIVAAVPTMSPRVLMALAVMLFGVVAWQLRRAARSPRRIS